MPIALCIIAVISILSTVLLLNSEKSEYIGKYINFGSHAGRPVIWQIINQDPQKGLLLVSKDIISVNSFDKASSDGDTNRIRYGSNLWANSDIRNWLNSADKKGFLAEFSDKEKSLINCVKNKVLLSTFDKNRIEGGSRSFYWSNIPNLVDQNYDNAYYMNVEDKVFLLDVREFRKYIFDQHLQIVKKYNNERNSKAYPYWLETAYYGNSSMVRVVSTDGFIYHKDACVDDIGIVPAIYLKQDNYNFLEKGSNQDPYMVQ
jgi:hypothetical protein